MQTYPLKVYHKKENHCHKHKHTNYTILNPPQHNTLPTKVACYHLKNAIQNKIHTPLINYPPNTLPTMQIYFTCKAYKICRTTISYTHPTKTLPFFKLLTINIVNFIVTYKNKTYHKTKNYISLHTTLQHTHQTTPPLNCFFTVS